MDLTDNTVKLERAQSSIELSSTPVKEASSTISNNPVPAIAPVEHQRPTPPLFDGTSTSRKRKREEEENEAEFSDRATNRVRTKEATDEAVVGSVEPATTNTNILEGVIKRKRDGPGNDEEDLVELPPEPKRPKVVIDLTDD